MQDLRAAVFFLPVYAQSLNTDYKDRADQQVKWVFACVSSS